MNTIHEGMHQTSKLLHSIVQHRQQKEHPPSICNSSYAMSLAMKTAARLTNHNHNNENMHQRRASA